ncbi:hypothetical protein KDW_60090 [Dictyobacter vulcani]|uniref:Cupin type-2 domain-containing protein n=1 Tax=Dictyobacter vulcani TaxID=2607529 RepID=A0A5J4KZ34_9CHLR|nr:cupin domain-containing protein [Dictyobacter vulcani]GER91847.1 hypothetical protein KDW_60090 [Dictyobacter vulcani]
MAYTVSNEALKLNATASLFQGQAYGDDLPVSVFQVASVPGGGPSLHVHPYPEVFVLHRGEATFTVGDETLKVSAGHVVVAPANTPHKFKNTGDEPLLLFSVHPNKEVIQEGLEND